MFDKGCAFEHYASDGNVKVSWHSFELNVVDNPSLADVTLLYNVNTECVCVCVSAWVGEHQLSVFDRGRLEDGRTAK